MPRDKALRARVTESPLRLQDGTPPAFVTPTDLAAAIAAIFPITPAHGGTGTATVFTPGSIVFASGSGIYAQDNADLFWDNTNKRLGILTNAPTYQMDMVSSFAGPLVFRVKNLSGAGGNTHASFICENSTSYGQLFKAGTGYVGYKNIAAGDLGFFNITAGNISTLNDAGNINFAANGAVAPQLTISSAGIDVAGAVTSTGFIRAGGAALANPAAGDLATNRGGNPGSGAIFFGGSAGLHYVYYDGTQFHVTDPINFNNGSITSFGPIRITAGPADNKNIYLTGAINSANPAVVYFDTTVTGISGGSAQGFYLGPSFALAGNAPSISGIAIPTLTITLNGHTLTDATALYIQDAPTNGTNRRALWVNAGLSQFDGPVSLASLSLPATGGAPTSGTLTLIGGTKTIATTAATATSVIFFQRKTAGGTVGDLTYTQINNTSFTLNSANALDTSVVNWWIVETH